MRRKPAARAARSIVINLRADERRRALIDRAAEAVGKNRSEFMLDAATREATTVLLDCRFFQLDPRAFKRFAAALDAARQTILGFAHCSQKRLPGNDERTRRQCTRAPDGRP
jgi:uncharacterized protein (DUF1778 family)